MIEYRYYKYCIKKDIFLRHLKFLNEYLKTPGLGTELYQDEMHNAYVLP